MLANKDTREVYCHMHTVYLLGVKTAMKLCLSVDFSILISWKNIVGPV